MPDAPNGGGTATGTESQGSGGRSSGATDEGRGVAERLLRKFRGKATDALAHMADEAKELREDRRQLREKLKGFEGSDVLVLRGDDLKRYNELKVIIGDKKPEDVKTELAELGTLRTDVATTKRKTAAIEAAPHLGWNAEAFAGMVADKNLEVTLVDSKDKDGKAIKIPHVKPASDPKATAVSAADWVKNNASYLEAALTAKPASSTTQSTTQKPATGTQFVEQGSTSASANNGANGAAAKPTVPGMRTYKLPSQMAAGSGDKK